MSECQILAGGPGDQEAVGIIEAARITVGRGHVQRDDGALGDWRAGDLVVFGRLTKGERTG